MNKRIIIGLISGTVLIWASVLTVVIQTSDIRMLESGEHGFTRPMTMEKHLNDQSTADFFERIQGVENDTTTIFGGKTLTKAWVNDVREDGKLSIDTLLNSLEFNDTDNS
ncbi:hypothetical protein ACQ4XT_10550 [Halobacillus faecis]